MAARSVEHQGTALITGASAGIGRELAKVFAGHGFDLIVVARTQSKLESLAEQLEHESDITVHVIPCDLTAPGAPQALFDQVAELGLDIDVLVNNAGTGHFVPFAESSLEKHLEVLQLNIVQLTALTRLFLDPMLKRNSGRIMNVASVAAFQPTPRLAIYGATKAFVLSLTESLSVELNDTGVSVSALCPGFTDTELAEHLTEEAGDPAAVPDLFMLDPATVAQEGYDALMEGKVIHVNGLTYQMAILLQKLQPRWMVRELSGAVARLLSSEKGEKTR